MRFGLKVEIASPRHQESQQNQPLGGSWRNAGRSGAIAGLLLAAAGAVQAAEPDLLTFDRIAYELAVLDAAHGKLEAEADGVLFADSLESLPPCAGEDPPTWCDCPVPPWVICP